MAEGGFRYNREDNDHSPVRRPPMDVFGGGAPYKDFRLPPDPEEDWSDGNTIVPLPSREEVIALRNEALRKSQVSTADSLEPHRRPEPLQTGTERAGTGPTRVIGANTSQAERFKRVRNAMARNERPADYWRNSNPEARAKLATAQKKMEEQRLRLDELRARLRADLSQDEPEGWEEETMVIDRRPPETTRFGIGSKTGRIDTVRPPVPRARDLAYLEDIDEQTHGEHGDYPTWSESSEESPTLHELSPRDAAHLADLRRRPRPLAYAGEPRLDRPRGDVGQSYGSAWWDDESSPILPRDWETESSSPRASWDDAPTRAPRRNLPPPPRVKIPSEYRQEARQEAREEKTAELNRALNDLIELAKTQGMIYQYINANDLLGADKSIPKKSGGLFKRLFGKRPQSTYEQGWNKVDNIIDALLERAEDEASLALETSTEKIQAKILSLRAELE